MLVISDTNLGQIIQPDLRDYISLASAISSMPSEDIPKSLISRLLLEASKCEELLDAYGASRNKCWAPIRQAMAFSKAFSRVIYNLFHIRQSVNGYKLLPVEGDFEEATETTLQSLLQFTISFSDNFIKVAKKMKLYDSLRPIESYQFRDTPIQGILNNNKRRKLVFAPGRNSMHFSSKSSGKEHSSVCTPDETAVYLASRFLALTEDGDYLNFYKNLSPNQYDSAVPDIISEEKLRALANGFHSLQSLYDTYLSASEIAEKDKTLPVMRGHITVVFHLLDTAVTMIHFYERHMNGYWSGKQLKCPVSRNDLLNTIVNYFIIYADRYLMMSRELCHDTLKSYAIPGEITVPIPNYRGFHVRPSTLIAKIVTHYGSDVKMTLDSTVYNAAKSLDLFRANEDINRQKRDSITKYIMQHGAVKDDANTVYKEFQAKRRLKLVFLDLLEQKKVVLYDNDMTFDDLKQDKDEVLADFIKRAITLYLATGKIDIVSQQTVCFQGDLRVLEDIKILAEHGYGEDQYGNNIFLPQELSYLKR